MSNTDGKPFIPCTSSRPSGVAKDERNFVGSAAVELTQLTRDLFWQAVALLTDKKRRDSKTTWLKPGLVARVRYLKGSSGLRHATVMRLETGRALMKLVDAVAGKSLKPKKGKEPA